MSAVLAEWTKLRTVASTYWLLAAAVVGTAGIGALMTVSLDARHCEGACVVDTVQRSLYGVRLGQVAVAVLAVLVVAGEWGTGTIRPSVAAMPRRALALLGKLAVLTATVLVAGAVSVGASLLVGAYVVPRRGFAALALGEEPARRAAAGSVLYLALIALLAAGIALIVRDTGAAIGAVLAVLFVVPLLASMVAGPKWAHRLHRWGPMDAGLAVQMTRHVTPPDIGPWAGLGVLALYAAGAVVIGLLLFELRDV
ncbi:ABC transporter permease [Dactylosporangium darangshiense]|uniref:ABC transporter permease subunit n=1 Tax=Dactylosporangium darangshiense TaxID=579108 RepID=A0ABP8DHG8_9ACTN